MPGCAAHSGARRKHFQPAQANRRWRKRSQAVYARARRTRAAPERRPEPFRPPRAVNSHRASGPAFASGASAMTGRARRALRDAIAQQFLTDADAVGVGLHRRRAESEPEHQRGRSRDTYSVRNHPSVCVHRVSLRGRMDERCRRTAIARREYGRGSGAKRGAARQHRGNVARAATDGQTQLLPRSRIADSGDSIIPAARLDCRPHHSRPLSNMSETSISLVTTRRLSSQQSSSPRATRSQP